MRYGSKILGVIKRGTDKKIQRLPRRELAVQHGKLRVHGRLLRKQQIVPCVESNVDSMP
jgi:hypothetical protein